MRQTSCLCGKEEVIKSGMSGLEKRSQVETCRMAHLVGEDVQGAVRSEQFALVLQQMLKFKICGGDSCGNATTCPQRNQRMQEYSCSRLHNNNNHKSIPSDHRCVQRRVAPLAPAAVVHCCQLPSDLVQRQRDDACCQPTATAAL